jgi:hypothetical protein
MDSRRGRTLIRELDVTLKAASPLGMSEFEKALKAQGKYISPVLLELGWRRKRIWSTTGQYHRYWEPPPRAD